MHYLLRCGLLALAASSQAACGTTSKQQQAASPNQEQAYTPQEASDLQYASNQQQQMNQQQEAEKKNARDWYSDSSKTCAAQIPQVFISVQDAIDGVKVMYYTTSLANIDPLRNNVSSQLENPSGQARASGGTPMTSTSELPPVDIKTMKTPDGVTVFFKAKNPSDADRVRQVIREDVHEQQLGNCSMLRVPDSADVSKD